MAKTTATKWTMKFDGSSMANSGAEGIILYHGKGETIVLSFNNAAE